jgi:hypothetical protein
MVEVKKEMRWRKISGVLVCALLLTIASLPVIGGARVDVVEKSTNEITDKNYIGTITVEQTDESPEPSLTGDVYLEYTVSGFTMAMDGFNLAPGSYNIYLTWSTDFTGFYTMKVKDQTSTIWLQAKNLVFNGAALGILGFPKVDVTGSPAAGAQTLNLFAIGMGRVGIYFEDVS